MSWECGCGALHKAERAECGGCGTPRGMVVTPQGSSKTASHSVSNKGSVKQGYAFGYITAVLTSILFFLFISYAIHLPKLLIPAVFMGLIAIAAFARRPWAWCVLLTTVGLSIPLSVVTAISATTSGSQVVLKLLVRVLVALLWFVYFYKRRVMFGAKGRWHWFEETFPEWVGPEEGKEETPGDQRTSMSIEYGGPEDSWECGCGVSNPNWRNRCAGCSLKYTEAAVRGK